MRPCRLACMIRSCLSQLSAIQFHLITTTTLLLSREGLRRGCLRFKPQGGAGQAVDARQVLSVAWLVLPAGVIVTAAVTCGVLLMTDSTSPAYNTAVVMHGAFCLIIGSCFCFERQQFNPGFAALLELSAEPLYVLSLINLRFKLRFVRSLQSPEWQCHDPL